MNLAKEDIRRYQLYIKSIKKHGKIPESIVPKAVQIDVTNQCNVKCTFCERWRWINEEPGTKKYLSKNKIISFLREVSFLGVERVYLSGGEPTLRKDMNDIIYWIGRLGRRGVFITNGILMTREICHALYENNFLVIFSVAGKSQDVYNKIRKIRDTDKATCAHIKYLTDLNKRKKRARVSLNMVVTDDNVKEINATLEMGRKLKVDEVCLNLPNGFKNLLSRNSLDKIVAFYKKYDKDRLLYDRTGRLKALANGLLRKEDVIQGIISRQPFIKYPVTCFHACDFSFIDTFGNVFPCCWANYHTYSYDDKRKERTGNILGNILEESFSNIWFGPAYNKLRVELTPVNIKKKKFAHCIDCDLYFKFKELGEIVNK